MERERDQARSEHQTAQSIISTLHQEKTKTEKDLEVTKKLIDRLDPTKVTQRFRKTTYDGRRLVREFTCGMAFYHRKCIDSGVDLQPYEGDDLDLVSSDPERQKDNDDIDLAQLEDETHKRLENQRNVKHTEKETKKATKKSSRLAKGSAQCTSHTRDGRE